jgi:hypothetical protein
MTDSAMRLGVALALLGTFLIGIVAVSYAKEFLAVDSCLDSGGSFDYSRRECDHQSNHPFVRYSERHPAAELIAASGALVAIGGLTLMIWQRKRGRAF